MSDERIPDLGDDDVLLAELRAALASTDPIPEPARNLARAAFDLGRVDDELAELVFDSLLDEPEVAMRSLGTLAHRAVAFIAGGLRIDLDLVNDDGGMLLGQIHPAGTASVVLERSSERLQSTADDLGRFQFPMQLGSARLRFTLPDGHTVVTPWITW